MSDNEFDISKWERGTGGVQWNDDVPDAGKDFDINAWERGTGGVQWHEPSPTSVEGRPQVQPPQVNMQEDLGPAAAGKLSGLPGVNPHTPTTKEGIGDVALAAAPLAGAADLPGVVHAVYAASRAHPVVSAFAYHVARELGVPLPKILDVFGSFGGGGK